MSQTLIDDAADVMSGPPAPLATVDCLAGGGDMGEMMRRTDWSKTPVGPVTGWSQSLRTMVGLVLRNRFPLSLWWGPDLVQFYNDPFVPTLGAKHPLACGQSGRECWAEIWHIIGPMIEGPFAGGPATGSEDLALLIHRRGFFEETHFRVAYSPVPDEAVAGTGIGGVLATVSETTAQVQAERQLDTVRELASRAAEAKSASHACKSAAAVLASNLSDVPFSLLYLLERGGTRAVLAASTGFVDGAPAAPVVVDFTDASRSLWPLATCAKERRFEVVELSEGRFGSLPTGAWLVPPSAAIVLPLALPDQEHPYGVMIAGINPHRRLDDHHRGFFEMAAAQVVTAIRNARAFEEAQERADALAKLDQAKTTFFSNVSHEFRTPLALMIGPTEDALASAHRSLEGEQLEMVHRNELRLLKLVNSLLDFSRMEAGRVEASFQATDLAQLTVDLTSQFRAAMEKGGLRLIVDAPPLPAPAFVDRDMWEKIVLNLLSNAFKHTFEGDVTVRLATVGGMIELSVRDSGVGIAPTELPRIFERFHRVRGARTRSHEGTGIGLALVRDLVKLHGGRIEVESREGAGTCMTVAIPTGSAHLPADRIEAVRSTSSTAVGSAAYVNDALSWLPPNDPARRSLTVSTADSQGRSTDNALPARLVLADDNADMREYLRRLLSTQWTVEAVADGTQALEAVRRLRPDLLVADVMMPGLDGLALTREVRADPLSQGSQGMPIILLSARTGDEATSEGLAAGANDYIVKPFSSRELVARVRVQLEIARSLASARAHESARVAEEQIHHVGETLSHAKDEFMAVLGHELRNPLAPILTALELMKARGDGGSLEREVIERQVKHVVRLVDDLLDVSRIARGKLRLNKQSVAVEALIVDAIEIASPLLDRRSHKVIVNVAPRSGTLSGDPFRLAQILSNLLTNAAKFTPVGGTITISAAPEGATGATIVIRVKDTGIGMEPDLLARVFEPFAQAAQASDRAQGGLGLGLTIVKNLVTLHDGQIEAHSEGPGTGSEFVIRLPAENADGGTTNPRAVVDVAPRGALVPRLRILVVDDNEDAAIMLSTLLRRQGHEVVVAYDGPEALRARLAFEPDVALLDIGLPGMDGYELARTLRARYPTAPLRIIAVSGYAEERDRLASKAAGFDEHLVKPVDLTRLGALIAAPAEA